MRLSANPDSPHFHWRCMEAEVFLNGTKITNCIEADEESGQVVVIFPWDGQRDELPTGVLSGKVEIRLSVPA